MKLLTGLFALALVTGCAGTGTKLDAHRAKGVKTVAIIGFEVQQQQPTDNAGINALKNAVDNGGLPNSRELQTMATNVYTDLTTQLQAKTGWKVLSWNEIATNPTYKGIWTPMMSGWHATAVTGQNTEVVPLNGLLDVTAFRKLSATEKANIAKALGVDAIAEYTVYQSISQPWASVGHWNGQASFEYKSRSNLVVWSPNSADPIWQIQNVDGLPESSKAAPAGPQLSKIGWVGAKSANSSITALVNNWKLQ